MSAESPLALVQENPHSAGWAARKSAFRSLLSLTISCLLSATILGWIWHLHGLDLALLLRGSKQANAAGIAAVFASSAAFGLLIGAHKLHLVLRSMGVRIRYRETLLVRLGSAPARALLPFGSGELLQLFYLRAAGHLSLARASGAVAFDKGTNFVGALLWLAAGALMIPGSGLIPASIARATPMLHAAIVAMLLAALVAVFAAPVHALAVRWSAHIHPTIARALSGLLEPFRELELTRKLLLIGYGLLFQARPLAVCYLLLSSCGFYPGVRAVAVASAASVFAGYAPGFIAGSGPREAVLLELLEPAGVPPETGFLVGALMTLSVNVVPAILGAPWVLWMVRKLRAPSKDASVQGGA